MSLHQNHLDDLQKSGLSDEMIERAQLYTESDPEKISGLLNWDNPAKQLGPCLVIPFFDLNGNPTGYHRLKPDKPILDRKRKLRPRKYEAPRGRRSEAYFPPGILENLSDPNSWLIITEGEKKALKATQEGFPTIGLSGVWNWALKRTRDANGKPIGDRVLLPELAAIDWTQRKIGIVFDGDFRTKDSVRQASKELTSMLKDVAEQQLKRSTQVASTDLVEDLNTLVQAESKPEDQEDS